MKRKLLGGVWVLVFGCGAAMSDAFASPSPDSEALQMCVDESAHYDAPFPDAEALGIASRPMDHTYNATWLLGSHGGSARLDSQSASILSLLGVNNVENPLIDECAAEPAALKVFCLKPEWGATCSNRCIKAGLGCAPMHTHPYKSGEGWGLLFSCNTLAFGHMCGFQFKNGDACYVPSGPLPPYCVYIGGQ